MITAIMTEVFTEWLLSTVVLRSIVFPKTILGKRISYVAQFWVVLSNKLIFRNFKNTLSKVMLAIITTVAAIMAGAIIHYSGLELIQTVIFF